MTSTTTALISVIIPCYKQAHFLIECIESLQAQTYQNWEAIIINDGSPDNTNEVAGLLLNKDRRIRYIEKCNGGLSSARNTGLLAAQGEYIQFLDADDKLESEKFAQQIAYLRTDIHCDLVYGNATYFFNDSPNEHVKNPFWDGSPMWDWIAERAGSPTPLLEKIISDNLFPVCAPLIRRRAILLNGIFNEKLTALEDWEYWIRCAAKNFAFQYLNSENTQALIRVHSRSMTHDKIRMDTALATLRIATLPHISDRKLRVITLSYFANALGKLPAHYNYDYRSVFQVLKSGDEKAAVYLASLFGFRAKNNKILNSIFKMLPWRFQAVLLG